MADFAEFNELPIFVDRYLPFTRSDTGEEVHAMHFAGQSTDFAVWGWSCAPIGEHVRVSPWLWAQLDDATQLQNTRASFDAFCDRVERELRGEE